MPMSTKVLLAIVFISAMFNNLHAQENFPVNGVPDTYEATYLLQNATIHPGNELDAYKGSVLIQDGRIIKTGDIPGVEDAIVVDLEGMHIYPSFIDLYAQYGLEDLATPISYTEQLSSDKRGAYAWNETIRSEFRAHEEFTIDEDVAATWRNAGFGAVLSHRMDGISRGSGSMIFVADESAHEVFLMSMAAHHLSLKRGKTNQDYPSSQMGSIALLRQTFYDGTWYKIHHKDLNISMEKWNEIQELPTVIEASGQLGVFRVDKIGDEFNRQFIIKGTGMEYRKIDGVKAMNAPMIIPVNFPAAFDVEDPWQAESINIKDLKHWELAPYNLRDLHDAGITVAITSHELKDKNELRTNVRRAIECGLPHDIAVKALTEVPARLMNVFEEVGSIEAGKWANLLVTSEPVFNPEAKIYQNWVKGKAYQLEDFPHKNDDGEYDLVIGDDGFHFTLSNSTSAPEVKIHLNDTSDIDATFSLSSDNQIIFNFALPASHEYAGYVSLSGWKSGDEFRGKGKLPSGEWVQWKAVKIDGKQNDDEIDEALIEETTVEEQIGKVTFPFAAFGQESLPSTNKVLFKNATVWTNEEEGILQEHDVMIDNGKIIAIGLDLEAKDAIVVNGSGMHLTSGIIDEHSHIAVVGGVNEGSIASSSEVRIGDVVNSEDIDIYRQLAGGVTAAQLLHGSSNPIGGQSALIKLRWGSLPEEMKINGADGFIKFALGENVKRSNWSSGGTIRFPQTRMGVEQVYVDHFTRAAEYDIKDPTQRKDLRLEALAEILNKERFITCHSYVQSEINMLMKVTERFGIRVNTFTHILEGYKVADKMKAHGVGGSTFSDWWAYKYEVIDAIPHNAALLAEMGVVTAINSDDAEMGRRLNQEAAKAVKYGGASEEEAWKMVTLNPAKLLHLDDRMGSIKVGKDADLVLWSDNPLSVYAIVQQTYVDGKKYFDVLENEQRMAEMDTERARLIQKMLEAKKGGAEVVAPVIEEQHHYHCDDLEDWAGNDHQH